MDTFSQARAAFDRHVAKFRGEGGALPFALEAKFNQFVHSVTPGRYFFIKMYQSKRYPADMPSGHFIDILQVKGTAGQIAGIGVILI